MPQTGQRAGMSHSRSAPVRRSTIGRTTSGMTSPAFWRTTWSPIRMSLRRTSSRLWRVARATVEPATLTGVRWATGVSVPVRPTYGDDVLDDRLDLLRRELVGDRPARRAADHPEPLLLVEAVDLDDDAVGLVRQVVARLAPALGERDDALDVEAGLAVRVDREAERLEALERRRLAGDAGRRAVVLDQLVGPGRRAAGWR